jgi:hypothetical protein
MGSRLSALARTNPILSFTPVRSGLLQRKCACGGTPGPTGECEACRKKKLQRHSENPDLSSISHPPSSVSEVPPIVDEVLRSPGQPLDAETRTFMEPRFGHDFSTVRVHTDARAIESAGAMNAHAYTVGHNIVFGARQYAPRSSRGKRLLAHELTHSLQQGSQTKGFSESGCLIYEESTQLEQEANDAADQLNGNTNPSAVRPQLVQVLQRQKSDKPTKEASLATPFDFLPGITHEHTFARSETFRQTPEFNIKFVLSLIGSVTLGPANSVLTVTKDELSGDFEKFGTNLSFTVGETLEDLKFKSLGVNFGPYKGTGFTFKPPRTYASSTKLPRELVLGRLKIGGDLRIELEAELTPKSPPPESVPRPLIDPKAILGGAVAGGLFLLGILKIIGERAVAPIILLIPPVDDYSSQKRREEG